MACTYMEGQQRLQFRKYIIIEGADFLWGKFFVCVFNQFNTKIIIADHNYTE